MAGLINFEDENEVKQFLDNIGVEYSFQCYKEKDPEGMNLSCPAPSGAELHEIGQWGVAVNCCNYVVNSHIFICFPVRMVFV